MLLSNVFVHHVFFWLKNPDSIEDREKLIAGLKKLSAAGMIKESHIGQPAATTRGVIETSYTISWLTLFDNAAAQDAYQAAPIHLDFVATCSPLWNKIVVFDSEDAR